VHSRNTGLPSALQGLDLTLNQLARVSTAIRKSGTRLRYEKADRTLQPHNYQDLTEHLTLIILCTSGRHIGTLPSMTADPSAATLSVFLTTIRKRLSDPVWLTAVQHRLITANVKRRHRFTWARHHEKKFTGSSETTQVDARSRDTLKAREVNPLETPSTASKSEKNARSATGQNQNLTRQDDSWKSATDLGSQFLVPHAPSTKAVSVVTKVSATGKGLDYPLPPKLPEDRKVFECPYCHQVLPKKYAQKGWRSVRLFCYLLDTRDSDVGQWWPTRNTLFTQFAN
jgi:hypothetical protein